MQFDQLKRREFMTLLGGGTLILPFCAQAQQSAMPAIGFLSSASAETFADRLRAFRDGLKEAGYIEGQNVTIEYRWAKGQNDQMPPWWPI